MVGDLTLRRGMTLIEILVAVAILSLALLAFLTVALAARGAVDKGRFESAATQAAGDKLAAWQAQGFESLTDGTTTAQVAGLPQGTMTVTIGPLDGAAGNADIKQVDVVVAWSRSADGLPQTAGQVRQSALISRRLPPASASGRGSIRREYWLGAAGATVGDIPLGAAPSGTDSLSRLEGPTGWGDSYGDRIRGYLTAPATGSYTFWLAGDDAADLWLSADTDPANRQRIAFVSAWTNPYEWAKTPGQKSAPISLTAGQKYYVEVLHKENTGGDHVAVGWAKPGQSAAAPAEIVPGSVLSPF